MKKLLPLLCLLLGACITVGRRDVPVAVYDFGPPALSIPATEKIPPTAIEVRAPHWLDSLPITYRLAYAEPARLYDYAQARWAGPPASLIERRLADVLGMQPAGQSSASCMLRLDIEEFSQVFSAPGSSQGVLVARASLLDRSRGKLAEHRIRLEKPAPSPDSSGGVEALTAAVQALGGEIGNWRKNLQCGRD